MPPTHIIPHKGLYTVLYDLAMKPDSRFLLGFVSGFLMAATLLRKVNIFSYKDAVNGR